MVGVVLQLEGDTRSLSRKWTKQRIKSLCHHCIQHEWTIQSLNAVRLGKLKK